MKILLIGGTGFIGLNFLHKYHSQYEITSIQRKNHKQHLDEFNTVNFIECDITNSIIQKIILEENPEVIVILASFTGLKNCQNNPEKTFETNVFGLYNILQVCTKIKPRIIFLSSREVYGESLNLKSNENDVLFPKNTYGYSKMLGESLIKKICSKNKINFNILRPSNVYGPLGLTGLNKILQSAFADKNIVINGGNQIINPIYVEDVVDCIHKLIQNKNSQNVIINIGNSDSMSLNQFVNYLCNIIDDKINIEYDKIPDYEVTKFIPDLKLMHDKLNCDFKFTVENHLDKTINFIKNLK